MFDTKRQTSTADASANVGSRLATEMVSPGGGLLRRAEAENLLDKNSIAVWSAGGAAGKSTIALNLAATLSTKGQRVALIDADTHSPALDLMLGLQQRTAGLLAIARLARQERYSDTEHERLVSRVGNGKNRVDFIAGLASVARWSELESVGMQAACEQISTRSDYQIFDLASPLDSTLIEPEYATPRNLVTRFLLGHCSTLVVVTTPDPVAIARLIAEFGELRRQSAGRILIVMNRFRTSVLGSNARRQLTDVLREHLGDLELFFVPDDPALFDSALAKATSVTWMRPRSQAARALRTLASEVESTGPT